LKKEIFKNKLEKHLKDISKITFLRSDVFDMPFKNNTVQTVLSFGVFHIFENPNALIKEIVRIIKPNAKLYLPGLCTDRKISKKYLNLLYKKGHVAKPLSSSETIKIVKDNGIVMTETKVIGGVLYILGRKANI
jgi:ubiquinone/menaquinone biosynthesis C-methylase UbiE